jgi:hypothetical protein
MLHRYNSFTEDLLLEKVINESFIYYTKDFKDNLIKLRNFKKSLIAQNLLEVEYTDVKPDMTFISLGEGEGDIKFTQFKKLFSLIKKGVEGRRYDEDITKKMLDAVEQKLSDGTITQNDINNLFTDTHYELSTKSRNSTGIGRLVNQIFPGKYSSKEVEEFVNNFKNLNKPTENKFELVSGEDIRKYYLVSNYVEEKGDLGNSCMRKLSCQTYLNIYVENLEIVKLLIYKNENDKILGRALIWKLNAYNDLDNKAPYFMDRVYTIDDATKKLFHDFAEKEKWAWRTSSTYHRSQDITFDGVEHDSISLEIQLDKWKFNEYPYMDTFKRLDPSDGILYNDEEEKDWTLTSTDGDYEDNNGVWSDYHDRRIPEDEAVYSDREDTYILRDTAVEVTLGSRRNRGWYPDGHNALVYDEFREEWINEGDSSWSEFLDKPFFNEDEEYIITWVDDDIYSHAYNKFRGDNELVSDQWTSGNVISTRKMDCYSYIEYNGIYSSIFDQIVSLNERDNYYFNDLKVKVYETEDGLLSEEDCEFLGVELSGKSYTTDELAYLFRNPNLERILEACRENLNNLENTLSGKQSRLKFEDDEDYIKKVEQKIRKLNWRIEILEDWID